MPIKTRAFHYTIDGNQYTGHLAAPAKTPAPGVLVCHAWAGRSPAEDAFAEKLAGLGYAGIAIDLYGAGVLGATKEECQNLMTPFMADRAMLQARLLAILDIVKAQPEVDSGKTGAIGFCFGGLCVLDLARSGGDVAGVASFHGLLGAPGNTGGKRITSKIAAYHGWDDPMVPPKDVVAFADEMTAAGADWRLLAHGHTMHAFMAEAANDPGFGTVYNKQAADRSWQAMTIFFAEIFSG